ncbi:MAG: protein kinase, partial [Planctomycetia bacterium]
MNLPLQDKKQAGSIETLPVIPPVTDKASSAAPGDVATMIQSGEETVADEGDQVPPIHRTPANRQTQAVSPETAGVASEETLDDTPAGLAFGQQVPAELHISGLNSRMEPKQAGTTADPQATLIGGPQAVRDLEDLLETLVESKTSDGGVPNGVAGLVIGDYQVISELGRGGMGVVYKARHRKLNRVVALKMILSGKHAGGEALRRFLAEARAVAQMQHPGIVQIFDIGEHQGLPYFS